MQERVVRQDTESYTTWSAVSQDEVKARISFITIIYRAYINIFIHATELIAYRNHDKTFGN